MALRLLTESNTKLLKGRARGWRTFVLHLAPARLSGYQTCPMATDACSAACIYYTGRGVFPSVQAARIRKTRLYFERRALFMDQLVDDLKRVRRMSLRSGHAPAVRLNGTSDITWEMYRHILMDAFPTIQFYDYTKLFNRLTRRLPLNYHLTFSYSDENGDDALMALHLLKSVAVIFPHNKPLPERWWDRPVVSGDDDDLRFLDEPSVVVGLKAKGPARRGYQPHMGILP